MAIDFPDNPSLNATFSAAGVTYTWDGTVWAAGGTASFLSTSDIGVTVQGYDATTLVGSDIGTTVQGYDADTAKTDAVPVSYTHLRAHET